MFERSEQSAGLQCIQSCTNGPQIHRAATFFNPCVNGATIHLLHNVPACSNGATNPPACTMLHPALRCNESTGLQYSSRLYERRTNPPSCTIYNPFRMGRPITYLYHIHPVQRRYEPTTCTVMTACTNGATNYPACTVFQPVQSVLPNNIVAQQLSRRFVLLRFLQQWRLRPLELSLSGIFCLYNWIVLFLTPNSGGYSSAVQDNRS